MSSGCEALLEEQATAKQQWNALINGNTTSALLPVDYPRPTPLTLEQTIYTGPPFTSAVTHVHVNFTLSVVYL